VMAHLIPSSEWTGEDLDIMASDNLEILYAMGADPNVIKETRVDSVYGLVGLMSDAYAQMPELSRPVLLLYGAKDQVIPPLPVAKAINALSAPHSVGYYTNGYHMLLRDKQRSVVCRDIMSWVDNRYRPLPSSADMGWKEELLGVE
jgi:acylglycerol lipase